MKTDIDKLYDEIMGIANAFAKTPDKIEKGTGPLQAAMAMVQFGDAINRLGDLPALLLKLDSMLSGGAEAPSAWRRDASSHNGPPLRMVLEDGSEVRAWPEWLSISHSTEYPKSEHTELRCRVGTRTLLVSEIHGVFSKPKRGR